MDIWLKIASSPSLSVCVCVREGEEGERSAEKMGKKKKEESSAPRAQPDFGERAVSTEQEAAAPSPGGAAQGSASPLLLPGHRAGLGPLSGG